MDLRWRPISRDSQRQVKFLLHTSADIWEVRRGLDPEADDSIDLSEFVKEATQSAFEVNVTCVFNRELFDPKTQPKPNQVLEVQLFQDALWKPLWIGYVDEITSFIMSRGERSMQLSAKTREQQDIWKNTRRVTPLFPQLTNLTYIVQRIARTCNLKGDEIALPPSSIMTAHSNTQMADMTAWDMISAVFVGLGWTPFIDSQGRLRAADRDLQARSSDIFLSDTRIIKIGGQRMRPPVSRVRVSWLNPALVRWQQQERMLTSVPVTIGWYLKTHMEEVKFSVDGTQRAEKTTFKANPSVEKWSAARWCDTTWTQQTPVGGKLFFDNTKNFDLYLSIMAGWATTSALSHIPVVGIFFGEAAAIAQAAFCALLLKMGPGVYEIWGTPYDFVHAKNVSEAFDTSVPEWVDNALDISCDYVVNEEHAKAIAIRELVYTAWSASKWSVTIVDDPRVEFGDILQFPDGSKLFVEDFTRRLERGSEAILDVRGFLLKGVQRKSVALPPAPLNTCVNITQQPQSQTITSGWSATLGVSSLENEGLSYQWYVGTSGNTSNPIAGAIGPTVTVSPTETTSYWVRITRVF